MARSIVCITAFCTVWVLCTRPAFALRPEVVRAHELYEDLHYDRAREAFEEALALEGNAPDDLATIFLHLGILEGAENDEIAAQSHFRRALQVDPEVTLPERLPPKITRPFARARSFWDEDRMRVQHDPPQELTIGGSSVLRFLIEHDRMNLVTGARLAIWMEDAGEERSYRQDGDGPFIFPIPADLVEQEGVVRYRLELLGSSSATLLSFGGDEGESVRVVEAGEDGGEGASGDELSRPVYRRWWFWTILGVVVAGAAVGTAVGLTSGNEGVEFGSPEVRR